MALVSKRAPILAFAATFLALCLIGWVARATVAQDAKPDPAPPALPAATPADLPPTLQDAPVAPSDAVKTPPLLNPTATPSNTPALISELPVSQFAGAASAKTEPAAPSNEPVLDANNPVGSDADDPEKSALAFVEHNQKTAESQLKSLRTEEAKLRDRLRKVESGIKRWESLLGALKQSQGIVAIVSPPTPGNWKQAEPDEPGPQQLDPIPLPKSKLIGVKK